MVSKPVLYFVIALLVLYFFLTYSYAGFKLETDSIADRVVQAGSACGVAV